MGDVRATNLFCSSRLDLNLRFSLMQEEEGLAVCVAVEATAVALVAVRLEPNITCFSAIS